MRAVHLLNSFEKNIELNDCQRDGSFIRPSSESRSVTFGPVKLDQNNTAGATYFEKIVCLSY